MGRMELRSSLVWARVERVDEVRLERMSFEGRRRRTAEEVSLELMG